MTRSADVWESRRAHLQTMSTEELEAIVEAECVVPLDYDMAELASSILYEREDV